MSAFLLSFGVIFVAELGDKSQLMAMTFAARYRFWTVLAGITVATAVVHLFSVAVGAAVGINLPTAVITVAAGVAFLLFGVWTLRGDELSEDEVGQASRVTKSAFVAVAIAFFLAELGDKTMLATIPWPPRRGGWAPGSARRSGWSPPTPWPSVSGRFSAVSCPNVRSASARPCCSFCSVRCSSSKGW